MSGGEPSSLGLLASGQMAGENQRQFNDADLRQKYYHMPDVAVSTQKHGPGAAVELQNACLVVGSKRAR